MAIAQQDLSAEVLQTRAASRWLVRELDITKTKIGMAGVTCTQGHILLHVETRGLVSVAELAELLRLDKSTTSRAVTGMINDGYVKHREDKTDKRLKPVTLTQKGRNLVDRIHKVANADVEAALATLTPEEREAIIRGMRLYARALNRSRSQRKYEIRTIQKRDNEYIARVIHRVMTDFDLDRPGTSISDDEVKAMYDAYHIAGAAYFVVVDGDRVVGGAGIGPLTGADATTCELKKMYLLPEARGLGIGEKLLQRCLQSAKDAGYKTCYLETIRAMTTARALYQKYGFRKLDAPLGHTGHFGCDSWFALAL
jgi:putative acetyltransferase